MQRIASLRGAVAHKKGMVGKQAGILADVDAVRQALQAVQKLYYPDTDDAQALQLKLQKRLN